MNSLDLIQGAWRLEGAPDEHPFGFPNTHWLIVGKAVMVIRDRVLDPRVFDLRLYLDPTHQENCFGIIGDHALHGRVELEGDMLFVTFHQWGKRRRRFGEFWNFEFLRDPQFPLPPPPTRATEPVTDEVLGRMELDRIGRWSGAVILNDGTACDISIHDEFRPLDVQLQRARELLAWVNENMPTIQTECGIMVREWASDDGEDREPWATLRKGFDRLVSGWTLAPGVETYVSLKKPADNAVPPTGLKHSEPFHEFGNN